MGEQDQQTRGKSQFKNLVSQLNQTNQIENRNNNKENGDKRTLLGGAFFN